MDVGKSGRLRRDRLRDLDDPVADPDHDRTSCGVEILLSVDVGDP